ncbi:hypothetical protein L484_020325 [Morus notabilis]|uniref:Chromo domain-containing protein n=1 Tax=Morus notabilis TaxID=981085 RepID=W9S438_9ROSA|nr:hypothetical protein L484_020325 [Morus notabilis]
MLVKWQGWDIENTTWESVEELQVRFPTFDLEDKVSFEEGSNVTIEPRRNRYERMYARGARNIFGWGKEIWCGSVWVPWRSFAMTVDSPVMLVLEWVIVDLGKSAMISAAIQDDISSAIDLASGDPCDVAKCHAHHRLLLSFFLAVLLLLFCLQGDREMDLRANI